MHVTLSEGTSTRTPSKRNVACYGLLMARQLLKNPARTGRDCYVYVRVSAGEHVQLSMPGQISIATRRAEAEGYRVIKVFRDEKSRGVRRDDLHAMFAAADANPNIGAIFFWDYRRVWGHQEQYRRINARAMFAGYRLVDSKGKDHTSETALELFVNSMQSNVSELETGTVGERAWDMNSEKVREYNQIVSRLPLGCVSIPYLDDRGKKRHRHEVVEADMAIVRRIFTEYADNAPTYRIAERLLADGIVTSKGKRTWSVAGIRAIIDNKFYIGIIQWNRTGGHWSMDDLGDKIRRTRARHESEHLTGVSPLGVILAENPSDPESVAAAVKLFEDCQAMRDRKGRERPPRKYPPGVLDGLVYCGRCDKRMHRVRMSHRDATGNRTLKFLYACPYRSNVGNGCSRTHTMSERQVFVRLDALLGERGEEGTDTPAVVTWRPASQKPAEAERALRDAETQVARRRLASEKVEEAWQAGVYELAEYKGHREQAAASLAAATTARDLAAAAIGRQPIVVERLEGNAAELLGELIELLQDEAIPLDARRAAAARHFEHIRIDNPRIEVWGREPQDA